MMLSSPPLHDLDEEITEALPLLDTFLQPVRAVQRVVHEQSYLIEKFDLDLFKKKQPHSRLSPLLTATTATAPTSIHSSTALITTPPLLLHRQAVSQIPTDCNSQINQFKSQFSVQNSQQLASVSQQAAASISRATIAQASAQTSADSANVALLAIQTSASQALSSASSSVSVADGAASVASAASSSAVASANSAIALANASGSSLVAIASASASSATVSASASISSAILSASSIVSLAQESASAAISSASSSIEAAKATATLAISQAQATVNSVNEQAAASAKASQVQAITATQAAIAIIGSIIGSLLLSILAYFLFTRYKRRKRRQKERAVDMEIKTAYVSGVTSLQSRTSSPSPAPNDRMSEPYVQPPSVFEFTLPRPEKKTDFWSFGSAKDLSSAPVMQKKESMHDEQPRPGTASRKPTLVCDPEFPMQPPKFGSFDRVSSGFSGLVGDTSAKLVKAKEVRRSEEEGEGVKEETIAFSGFDGDFSGNVAKTEDGKERTEEGRGVQRQTIGAAI